MLNRALIRPYDHKVARAWLRDVIGRVTAGHLRALNPGIFVAKADARIASEPDIRATAFDPERTFKMVNSLANCQSVSMITSLSADRGAVRCDGGNF